MHYAMMELTSQLDCMITRVRLSPPASRGFTRIGLASTQRPWPGRSYMYFNVEWIVKFSMGSVHMWWGSEIDRLIEIRFPVEIWMGICKMWRVLRSRLFAKWIFKFQCAKGRPILLVWNICKKNCRVGEFYLQKSRTRPSFFLYASTSRGSKLLSVTSFQRKDNEFNVIYIWKILL